MPEKPQKKTDLKKLEQLLAEFDDETVEKATRKAASPDASLVGYAVLQAGKLLQRELKARTPRGETAQNIGAGVTIDCGTSVTLRATAAGVEREYDLWGGLNADQTRDLACRGAEAEARANATADLNAQVALIRCSGRCRRVVNGFDIKITVPGAVKRQNAFSLFGNEWYEAEATASGTVVVDCVKDA